MDAARLLDAERDYRRQVRRVYYKREEDFATLRDYNDYLEEVEEIVDALLCEETRSAARARLDALRAASSDITARNRAKLDAEKRALSDGIAAQAQELQRRAEERRQAELQAAEQQRAQKKEMQDQIAAGRTSAATAEAELTLRSKEAAVQQAAVAAAAARGQPQAGGGGGGGGGASVTGYQYAPSAPQQAAAGASAALAQPLERQADADKKPKFMKPARLAATEEYELDPVRLRDARMAGGYRAELWRQRYRLEAFAVCGLLFAVQT